MKIFISWSGELSKTIAEALRQWLPLTLQAVRPYFTPSDIEKGARWLLDISGELESSSVGIFCITPDNLNSSWMLFEAGAISKSVSSARVCLVLVNVSPGELPGPLQQFQATTFGREDMWKLMQTINAALGEDKISEPSLEKVYAKWWPDLEQTVMHAMERNAAIPVRPRPERELLTEILEISRLLARENAALPVVKIASEKIRNFTEATLPTASASRGEFAWVTKAGIYGGMQLCFCDGNEWRVVQSSELE